MIRIQMDSSGMEARLVGLQGALRDLRPVWREVHDIFTDMIKQHFKTRGAYAGVGWVPLNPRYAAWKRRNYPGKPMMRLTDRLYNSLTKRSHEEHVFLSGPNFAEYGTRVIYARAHHFGYPPRRLPSRKVIPPLTKAEGERVVDVILAHLLKGAR